MAAYPNGHAVHTYIVGVHTAEEYTAACDKAFSTKFERTCLMQAKLRTQHPLPPRCLPDPKGTVKEPYRTKNFNSNEGEGLP